MGFDFTLIAPLLPSHCGFSSVLGRGVSSLVKSRVFLSMIVQQPVVILVLSQEGVRARPSTPPSWFTKSLASCPSKDNILLFLPSLCSPGAYFRNHHLKLKTRYNTLLLFYWLLNCVKDINCFKEQYSLVFSTYFSL